MERTAKVSQLVIAVDLDGTLHDIEHPVPGRKMGPPMAGAKAVLDAWDALGHTIIIHSVWAHGRGIKVIQDWLNYFELPFHDVTNEKPDADVYLDDKAVRFTSWSQVNEDIFEAAGQIAKTTVQPAKEIPHWFG